ncbi:lipid storage droplets surface-binding protein 2 isoform X2 [Pararge aegeria]|uniref:lipid storage droplets surface-binding protein 2 isoform X2 n=1 Tax=Pararge aegeria TaxID=116150 RepID=UPI0019D30F69|nr:lipid storage droplets surface-binding protein 2 isoform X2 [Pararge aegeria]
MEWKYPVVYWILMDLGPYRENQVQSLMATEVGSAPGMPQLQSVQKAMSLPAVGAAVGQVGAFYTRVKGAHSLLEWALSTAEASVTLAATTAVPYVAAHLAAGDAKVAAALDELERRMPLVAEQPKVIVETTKQAVLSRITPQLNKVYGARDVAEQRVMSLKELTWAKANVLLSSAYGQKALLGVDSGADYAMRLLDRYLPPAPAESAPGAELAPLASDPALHTVQTVGRLSAVAARRVWANLAARVQQLRANGIELDVRRYVTALLAALHLAKVTSQQQQGEAEPPQSQTAVPTTNGHHVDTHHTAPTTTENAKSTAPTTTEKVKSTPEAKSDGGDNHN